MQPPSSQRAPCGGVFPAAPEIIFTNWREELHRTGLSPAMKSVYAPALSGYLEYCSRNGVSVTEALERKYPYLCFIRALRRQTAQKDSFTLALRWMGL